MDTIMEIAPPFIPPRPSDRSEGWAHVHDILPFACSEGFKRSRPAAEREIVKEALSNAEIELWYRTYGPMVLRRCRQLLGNEERARDAMHETFVRVLQASSRIRGDFPSSLLFRVATNACLNIIRDDKVLGRSVRIDALDKIAGRDEPAARTLAGQWLDRLFRRANPATRDMAVLHFVDGMTFAEVAAETGFSESGVRKRIRAWLARARRAHEESANDR